MEPDDATDDLPPKRAWVTTLRRMHWIDALGIGLFLVLIGLTLYSGELDHAIMSMLFFGGAVMIHRRITPPDGPVDLEGRLVGFGILLNVIVLCVMYEPTTAGSQGLESGANPWLRFYPVTSAASWVLVAYGFRGLKRYWQMPFLFLFLGLPWLVLHKFFDMALITSMTVSMVLGLIGFESYLEQPLFVGIGTSRVSVNIGCSGMEAMTYLLGLAVLALLAFRPPSWLWYVLVPPVAVMTAFTINVIRVTCLSLFNLYEKVDLFDSFHIGLGSQLFSGASVGIFCVGYYLVHRWCHRGDWKTQVRSIKRSPQSELS